jgi:hypothetical protein
MIPITREEREWFLKNLARSFVDYLGAKGPPVEVEELLENPPPVFDADFGVVDMLSNMWDATFARSPHQQGSIFVRADLTPEERRYVLAREMLSALVTSKHGRMLGMSELILPHLRESAAFFARYLLVPDEMLNGYRSNGGDDAQFAQEFQIPSQIAAARWIDD